MANAPRTPDRIPTQLGLSTADLSSWVPWSVNPSTHALQISIGTSAVYVGSLPTDVFDENRVSVSWGVSDSDSISPLPVMVDGSGVLQVEQ